MSAQAIAHVWSAEGVTAEERLLLIYLANATGQLGAPYCFDWVAMGDFIGGDFHDAVRVAEALRDKGLLIWGTVEEETSHLCWITYGGEYELPPSLDWEPKKRSRRVRLLIERDGNMCSYCDREEFDYHVDHFIPRAKGGADIIANLVLACAPCNMAKRDQMPEVFLRDRPDLLRRIRIRLESETG